MKLLCVNDFVLLFAQVTKLNNKKKDSLLYNYRESFPLSGMKMIVFELPCMCWESVWTSSFIHSLVNMWRIGLVVFFVVPAYLLELFILTSACSGRRSLHSVSRGDFVVPLARTATWQKRAFLIVGNSLFGIVSPLTSVLRHGTFPLLFIDASWLSFLSEPGLGALLNSYLEGALYKFNK